MPHLGIIIASTREGRAGEPIADWFADAARRDGKFDVTLIDLKDLHLPLLEEPRHPRLQQYEHDETKAWSTIAASMDAFVFVTPEYNYGTPPALVNALDHLFVEWNYKAAGFVSYGGISGGTRSVQMTRLILMAVKMVPIVEAVHIPFFSQLVADGVFHATEVQEKAAAVMLHELLRWTDALSTLRRKA